MTTRREFLETAALTALPVVAGASLSGAASAAAKGAPTGATSGAAAVSAATHVSAARNLNLVLFDARFSEARAAAARVSGAGAAVHALGDGDITQVWLEHIAPAWQRGPAVIAGVTQRPALFCLEQLALGSGLRVVFHAEHVVLGDGRVEHSLRRGAERLGLASSSLADAGAQWATRVADALTSYRPLQPPGGVRFGRSDSALEPVLPARAQLLTSWIIAAA